MAANLIDSWKKSICDAVRCKHNGNADINNMSDECLVINYLTYIRKCIPYPVTVNESTEIKNMISDEIKGPYNKIKERLENGEGVAPYLSNSASKLAFDGLFLDWNILHLHLGNLSTGRNHAERTGNTLHLLVTTNNAYFIKISHHGRGAYTDLEEFRIIYSNWPNLLSTLDLTLDNEIDRYTARDNGISELVAFKDYAGNSHTATINSSLGYSMAKTSNYDLELLDTTIPEEITNIFETAKDASHESELYSEGHFLYDPKKSCFQFCTLDSQGKPYWLFKFNSNDLWKYVFSDQSQFPIEVH